jgi:hypothetical protein
MVFDFVGLISAGAGLNETYMGEGNSISKHNSLKRISLVTVATVEFSTIDEIPGGTIVNA